MSVFGKWKGRTLSGFDAKKISRNFVPYSVLVAALFAMTFFGVCLPNTGPQGPRGSAAYIMNEAIQYREFRRAYENYSRQTSSGSTPEVAQKVLTELIQIRAMNLLASEMGIQASEQSVLEAIQQIEIFKDSKTGAFDVQEFRRYLDNAEYTESAFFEERLRELTTGEFQQFVADTQYIPHAQDQARQAASSAQLKLEYLKWDPADIKPKITKEDISKFLASAEGRKEVRQLYDLRVNEYQRKETRRSRQILIAHKQARNALDVKRSKEEAKKLARSLQSQIKNGANFSTLAKSYSDDATTKEKGGQTDFLGSQDTTPELSKVIFSMKKGELSEVIESPFGFHIAELQEIKKAQNLTFQDMRKKLAAESLTKSKKSDEAKKLADAALQSLVSVAPPATSTPISSTDYLSVTAPSTLTGTKSYPWQGPVTFSAMDSEIPGLGESEEMVNMALLFIGKLSTSTSTTELTFPITLPSTFFIGGAWYVVRILAFTPPSAATEDKKDSKDPIAEAIRQYRQREMARYYVISVFSHFIRKLEQSDQIKRNPDYTELGRSSS